MNRWNYDLSCFNAVTGHIGQLQTIMTIPVVANDSIEINLVGALRLAQLKRFLTLDCKVDLFAFFSPYRHAYSNWVDAVRDGINTAETFATYDVSGGGILTVPPDYLGNVPNATIPYHYVFGYHDIYYNYFFPPSVVPTGAAGMYPSVSVIGDDSGRKYGQLCARLPEFWTTGLNDTRGDSTADAEVAASGGAGAINLIDLRRVQAEYKDALNLDWFGDRYRDVMSAKWGTKGQPNTDADPRPTLLMHESSWLSGYDVDGTDTTSLGDWRGKSQGMVQLRMPYKYFKEHGMIWIMAVLRFPAIMQEQCHYLSCNTLTYDNLMGDPNVISASKPIALDQDDFTGNGSAISMGTHPYAQWYRTQPHRVHHDFWGLEGMPFETVDDFTTHFEAVISDFNENNDFFINPNDLGHWNMISKAEINAKRVIPPAVSSIKTGTILH